MNRWAPYAAAFAGTLVSVGLKGFQHKNVVANLYVHTAITSYAMAFMDVLLIGLIARSSWSVAFASGTGAATGMVVAMWLHNRMMKKRNGLTREGTK
jgi:hypothetical protein